METKYKKFLKYVEKIEKESVRKHCKGLVTIAELYYPLYYQYERLIRVKRRLANYYELPLNIEGELKLREGQLDIISRLYIDFYKQLIDIVYPKSKNNLSDWIWSWYCKEDVASLFDELEAYDKEIDSEKLKKSIIISCENVKRIRTKKKSPNLGLDNIRTAIQIYKRNRKVQAFTKEKCFNEIYSEKYVDCLIGQNEAMVCMYLVPVMTQLMSDREIDSKAWKWCYTRDFRDSIQGLKKNISIIQKYDELFVEFDAVSKELNKVLKLLKS